MTETYTESGAHLTAALLDKAQAENFHVLHNPSLAPAFDEGGSVDHLIVMNRAVFLIRNILQISLVTQSEQRAELKKLAPLAPKVQERLSMLNYTVIPVRTVLAVWNDHDFTPVSKYVIPAGDLVAYLRLLNTVVPSGRIYHEKIMKQVSMPSTWSVDIEDAYEALGDRRGAE